MLILSIDTSCSTLGISLTENNIVLAESVINNKKTHSVKLMPTIDSVLNVSGKKISDVNLIAIINGPGSFTGLRIGVSCAKAFSYTLDIPAIGVNALDYLANSSFISNSIVCPIIDARNKQVYYSIYRDSKRLVEYFADSLDILCTKLLEYNENIYFTGDGVIAYRDSLKEIMGTRYNEVNSGLLLGKPSCISTLIDQYDKNEDLSVFYLRKPQAERIRDENKCK